MSNRELLELAAKAAGYEVIKEFPYQIAVSCGAPNPLDGVELFGLVIHDGVKVRSPWNPLDDDGDALRLGAVLELEVSLGQCGGIVYKRRQMKENIEELSQDYMAAIRRAIVLAAAEIGRGM